MPSLHHVGLRSHQKVILPTLFGQVLYSTSIVGLRFHEKVIPPTLLGQGLIRRLFHQHCCVKDSSQGYSTHVVLVKVTWSSEEYSVSILVSRSHEKDIQPALLGQGHMIIRRIFHQHSCVKVSREGYSTSIVRARSHHKVILPTSFWSRSHDHQKNIPPALLGQGLIGRIFH